MNWVANSSSDSDHSEPNVPVRKIIHVDMDAFFASVEQRDNPQYCGLPVVVGGPPDSRGVVAACSYEARAYGIHSAMPSSQAYRRCPDAIFLKPRFEAYRKTSRQIQALFLEYTQLVEPLSLDEAYLDVSACSSHNGSATLLAQEILQQIELRTGLTASAGVSYNKFLAKLASDMNKPRGLTVVRPEQALALLEKLEIRKFHGIGKATEARMQREGIYTGADLKRWQKLALVEKFGRAGFYYYDIVRGRDKRQVQPQRSRRSIGAERTLATDLYDLEQMSQCLVTLADRVAFSLQQKKLMARTVTIKVKYRDFQQVTRSTTEQLPFSSSAVITGRIPHLLASTEAVQRGVRLLGVSVSGLETGAQRASAQLSLFQGSDQVD